MLVKFHVCQNLVKNLGDATFLTLTVLAFRGVLTISITVVPGVNSFSPIMKGRSVFIFRSLQNLIGSGYGLGCIHPLARPGPFSVKGFIDGSASLNADTVKEENPLAVHGAYLLILWNKLSCISRKKRLNSFCSGTPCHC